MFSPLSVPRVIGKNIVQHSNTGRIINNLWFFSLVLSCCCSLLCLDLARDDSGIISRTRFMIFGDWDCIECFFFGWLYCNSRSLVVEIQRFNTTVLIFQVQQWALHDGVMMSEGCTAHHSQSSFLMWKNSLIWDSFTSLFSHICEGSSSAREALLHVKPLKGRKLHFSRRMRESHKAHHAS